MPGTRKADFYLGCLVGCVFIDFYLTNGKLISFFATAALPTNSFRFNLRLGKAAYTIQPYKSATQVLLHIAIVPGP
jgi:hypothetical protein